jgi:hypothetical protein
MDRISGPTRGGTRGGKDQFDWKNVASDKDREYYIGHSAGAFCFLNNLCSVLSPSPSARRRRLYTLNAVAP